MSSASPSFDQVWPYIDRVPGWMVAGQERFLFEKARSLPDGATIVEIGSFYGRSSCALAFGCLGTNKRIICIDPWMMTDLGNLDFFGEWQRNVAGYGLDHLITPLRGRSHDILADWARLTGNAAIDFIFIDGSHEYDDVLLDLQLSFQLVKDNGWMAFHDVCAEWPGSLRVWQEAAGPSLTRHQVCSTLACGMKTAGVPLRVADVPKTAKERQELTVQFFSEVEAGASNLATIPSLLQQLNFDWAWHVICPAPLGPDDSARTLLGRGEVVLHAPASPAGWKTRTDALSAVLAKIGRECLLWDLRSEDGWSPHAIRALRNAFSRDSSRTGALIHRERESAPRAFAWHCYPWFRWINPAAPQLVAMVANGGWLDVASTSPFIATEIDLVRRTTTIAQTVAHAA